MAKCPNCKHVWGSHSHEKMGWNQLSFTKNEGELPWNVPDVEAYQKFLKKEAQENECWCYTCGKICPIPEHTKILIEQEIAE